MHESADEHIFESILSCNDELAGHNRARFDNLGAYVVNLMSAPGAGKTTLLSLTIPELETTAGGFAACGNPSKPGPGTANGTGTTAYKSVVIEGDMVGETDARRLRESGITAFQISTGRSCHLDAAMVARLLHSDCIPEGTDFVFIENVGNLVCPAEFPLGEHKRVVLLSVTEGDDKPLKYPVIFRNCDAVVFTKCDLLPYVNFNLRQAASYIRDLQPEACSFSLSMNNQRELTEWLDWLREGQKENSERYHRAVSCEML